MLKRLIGILILAIFGQGIVLFGQTQPAVMNSPAPGSILPGTSVTFTWTAGPGVANCQIYIGSQPGWINYFSGNPVYTNSQTIDNLPADGSTLYVRLMSWIDGAWQNRDYTYTASTSPVTTAHQGNREITLLTGTRLEASSMYEAQPGAVTLRGADPYSPFNVKGDPLALGIGSRSELLSLQNYNGAFNNLQIFQLRNTGDPSWYSASTRIQNYTSGGPQGYIEFNSPGSPNAVAIGTGPSELMRLRESGNVGIGTTDPLSRLEVNGDIRLKAGSNGSIIFQDGTTLASSAALSSLSKSGDQMTFSGKTFAIGGGTTAIYGDGTNTVLQSAPGGSVYLSPIYTDGTRVAYDGSLRVGGPGQTGSSLAVTGRSLLGGGVAFPAQDGRSLGTVQIADSNPSLVFHYPANTVASISLSKTDNFHNTFKFRAEHLDSDGYAGIDVEGPSYLGSSGQNGGMIVKNLNIDPNINDQNVANTLNEAAISNKMLVAWNRSAGMGEHDFVAGHSVNLTGGMRFYDMPSSAPSPQLLMQLMPGETRLTGNLVLSAEGGSNNHAHITFPDGSQQTQAWTGVVPGADYADSVDVTGPRSSFEPGDLLVIDSDHDGRFQKASTPYSTLVSGVYATKPGILGRRQPKSKPQDEEVPMAMVGIVPTKVTAENGPIHNGDLLVSSSTPGYAMRGTDRNRLTGAVLGKAMGRLETGSGVIEVLISLQ